jgi:hypothetical protein
MGRREARKAEPIHSQTESRVQRNERNHNMARTIAESSLLSPDNIVAIVAENRELCRIIAASIKTARASTE